MGSGRGDRVGEYEKAPELWQAKIDANPGKMYILAGFEEVTTPDWLEIIKLEGLPGSIIVYCYDGCACLHVPSSGGCEASVNGLVFGDQLMVRPGDFFQLGELSHAPGGACGRYWYVEGEGEDGRKAFVFVKDGNLESLDAEPGMPDIEAMSREELVALWPEEIPFTPDGTLRVAGYVVKGEENPSPTKYLWGMHGSADLTCAGSPETAFYPGIDLPWLGSAFVSVDRKFVYRTRRLTYGSIVRFGDPNSDLDSAWCDYVVGSSQRDGAELPVLYKVPEGMDPEDFRKHIVRGE